MITEGIKSLLGDDLTSQVENALKGKGKDGKDIDIVVGNDGSYVPADKYNGMVGGKTSAENALKTAAEALKAIGGSGDPSKIADDVKVARETISTLQKNHEAEIKRINKNSALRLALNGKVHDPSDIISLLDLDSIDVDDAGVLKTDLESMLKPIKESKSYLFVEENKPDKPDIKGAKPGEPNTAQPAKRMDGPTIL